MVIQALYNVGTLSVTKDNNTPHDNANKLRTDDVNRIFRCTKSTYYFCPELLPYCWHNLARILYVFVLVSEVPVVLDSLTHSLTAVGVVVDVVVVLCVVLLCVGGVLCCRACVVLCCCCQPITGLGTKRQPTTGLEPKRQPITGLEPNRQPITGLGTDSQPTTGLGKNRQPTTGLGMTVCLVSGLWE